jgi:hypothetical protein
MLPALQGKSTKKSLKESVSSLEKFIGSNSKSKSFEPLTNILVSCQSGMKDSRHERIGEVSSS